jgi:hypothetical protein
VLLKDSAVPHGVWRVIDDLWHDALARRELVKGIGAYWNVGQGERSVDLSGQACQGRHQKI